MGADRAGSGPVRRARRPAEPARPELSVVVPILDEEECISALHEQLTAVLTAMGRPYEIIAVDDGSTDRSFELLRQLAHQDRHLRAIRLRRNFGQTAAFSAGFERAQGDIVVTIDADLQNDPADIPRLVAKLEEGYDAVSGWRRQRHDKFWSRRLPSRVANRLISWCTGVKLHDYGCSLKAYRADVVRSVRLYGELHRFVPAIASWQGIAVAEMPVNHAPRLAGRSKYGLGRTVRVLLDLVTVRFLLGYQTRPMQLFGLCGLATMLVGFGLGTYLTALKVFTGADIGDRPLLLLAVLLVVVGVQFIGIGLVGELLVRVNGAAASPAYVVREELNGPSPPGPVSAPTDR